MNFNFKKNNILIILLLILVILSCIVYINMLNVKEGLTNIDKTKILYQTYLTSITPARPDVSYSYYKLQYKTAKFYKITAGKTDLIMSDFSINDISYTQRAYEDTNIISDVSFIELHKTHGTFGISDLSNVRFYNYPNNTVDFIINIDLSSSTGANNNNNFNMLFKEFSGNVYDAKTDKRLSNLNVNIIASPSIEKQELIVNGKFVTSQETPKTSSEETLNEESKKKKDKETTIKLGDTNITLEFLQSLLGKDADIDSDIFAHFLQNGGYGSSYVPPIYNNFETAMNLPSNPIANPVNSMNPLEYAETLFGPNITPVMAKNSYLNQNNATTVEASANTMKAISSQLPNFDTTGNLLAQNSAGSGSNGSNGSNGYNGSNGSNSSVNTINTNKNIAKEDYPPCPAPQRCPEPNFECKKMPKYEQGIDNAFLPRPVLTDFSTFGM